MSVMADLCKQRRYLMGETVCVVITHHHHGKKTKRTPKKKSLLPPEAKSKFLVSFYRGAVESFLTKNICGSCTGKDSKALQRVIKTSQSITCTCLQSINNIN